MPLAERISPRPKGVTHMLYLPPPPEAAGALRDWLDRLLRELDRLEERVEELENRSAPADP